VILKVKGEHNEQGEEWLFIDNIASLRERKKAKLTPEEFQAELEAADHACIASPPSEGTTGTVKVGIVKGTTIKGGKVSVIFDTIAYLCNDRGDTLEKIWAN